MPNPSRLTSMADLAQHSMACAISLEERLSALRSRIVTWEAEHHAQTTAAIIPSFCPDLDRWLPHGGFRSNQLVEWFVERPGSGAGTLAMLVARQALQQSMLVGGRRGTLVILDPTGCFYPPAAVHCGISPAEMIIVHPRHPAEAIWAADQALRSPAVAVVWGSFPRLDARDARRLQLSAEEGDTLGLWMRPMRMRRAPSWADIQLAVRPMPRPISQGSSAPARETSNIGNGRQDDRALAARAFHPPASLRRWQIELLRCRGGVSGKILEWEWPARGELQGTSDETHPLPVVATLADPAPGRRTASA